MRLHHWISDQGNFGDDLNPWFWSHFAPDLFEAEDDIIFVGVGTILCEPIPRGSKQVVFGSGAGYSLIPADYRSDSWAYYAVRGPLTARLLDLPPATAVSDPAVLLPLMPGLANERLRGTVFVPHWRTAAAGLWDEPARHAGVEIVDPRGDARSVIRRIASAELVLAESMHGAIVADAFRVPWIPLISSHENLFKWHDWALSLGLSYRPWRIGAPHLFTAFAHHFRCPAATTARSSEGAEAVFASLASRNAIEPAPARKCGPGRAARLMARGERLMHRNRAVQARLVEWGARQLERVARDAPQLSTDQRLRAVQSELLARIERLHRDHRDRTIRGFQPGMPEWR